MREHHASGSPAGVLKKSLYEHMNRRARVPLFRRFMSVICVQPPGIGNRGFKMGTQSSIHFRARGAHERHVPDDRQAVAVCYRAFNGSATCDRSIRYGMPP